MFFGGSKGISAFFPENIRDNPCTPPVVLTDFQIFNKPVAIGKESPLKKAINVADQITLRYDQEVFRLRFAALSFAQPQKNRYAYKLEGFDRDWRYHRRQRSFRDLHQARSRQLHFSGQSLQQRRRMERARRIHQDHRPPAVVANLVVPGFGRRSSAGDGGHRLSDARPEHPTAQPVLQRQVAERTHELQVAKDTAETARQSAEAARHSAETANKAKSIFLANMSHELRTPLNAVLGFSQLMQNDRHATAEQKEYLHIINRSGEHLLNLINNVLDISKIESGRVELEETPLDLHQLAQEIKSLMHVRAQEKGLDFTLEQSPDLPRHVRADGGKLRQVLINLIGNAIKFTASGGVVLRAMAGKKRLPACSGCNSRWRTRAPASPRRTRSGYSLPSCNWEIARPQSGGRAWGLRSASSMSGSWAGRSVSEAKRAKARSSISRYR